MRPDYTLTLWPASFSENEAERQELIVHIHFDAKYKVEALRYLIDENNTPEEPEDFDSLPVQKQEDWLKSANQEKREEKEGTYKRADLLKMHAYKDAIRRTGGAYIIYPGSKLYGRKGFHEIIPGLGAFPLSPSGCSLAPKLRLEAWHNEALLRCLCMEAELPSMAFPIGAWERGKAETISHGLAAAGPQCGLSQIVNEYQTTSSVLINILY